MIHSSRFIRFRNPHYHAEWIKQVSECSEQLDELTRFLHSTWSSWCHNRNTITEFYLLAFYWLTIFTCSLHFFGNDVRKMLIVLKSRNTVLYLHFILDCFWSNYSRLFIFDSLRSSVEAICRVEGGDISCGGGTTVALMWEEISLLRGVGGGGEWSSEQDGIVAYISLCAFLPTPTIEGLWSNMGPVVMFGDQPACAVACATAAPTGWWDEDDDIRNGGGGGLPEKNH